MAHHVGDEAEQVKPTALLLRRFDDAGDAAFFAKEPSSMATSMREMSILALRSAPKLRCPTSLLPICPGGRPASGPLVPMRPWGYAASSASRFGVRARRTALSA